MGRSDLQKLLDQKKDAKKHLFDECWPDHDVKSPLVVILMTHEKADRELVFKLLEGLFVLPIHTVVVSNDDPGENVQHPSGRITWFNPESGRNAPKLDTWLLAADMAVVFDEKQNTLHALFDKGVVPVGHAKSPFLQNYQPNEETGNSFTYTEKGPWGVFAALVRACETYRFPYDWQHIIRGILKVR